MYSVNSDDATQMMSTMRRTKMPRAMRWGLEPGSVGATTRPSGDGGIIAGLQKAEEVIQSIT